MSAPRAKPLSRSMTTDWQSWLRSKRAEIRARTESAIREQLRAGIVEFRCLLESAYDERRRDPRRVTSH
jgi:hypothetical protein